MSPTPIKIAIVGAGPAGCTLARLLQHNSSPSIPIKVTIYEADESPDFRSQGGTLDIHEATGQQALREAGLHDLFLQHARYDGEALQIVDKNMVRYVALGPKKLPAQNSKSMPQSQIPTGRPEIDRAVLRKILYESLQDGTVQWGKKTTHVEMSTNESSSNSSSSNSSSTATIYFADGTSADGFDLVVGADGAWSKVRPCLSSAQPFFSGIAGHSLYIPHAASSAPELHALVNRGSLFAWSDGRALIYQQLGDGAIQISAFRRRDADGPQWRDSCGYDVHDPDAVVRALARDYAGWDDRLVAPMQSAAVDRTATQTRDLYMLPVGHRWAHMRGITLVGDAAHLMTPFSGKGVNLAMDDCLRLGRGVINALAHRGAAGLSVDETRDALDRAVASFEENMFERAMRAQQMTYDMMRLRFFTPGSPRAVIERLVLMAVRDKVRPWLMPLVTPLVYAWFFVFKLFH